MAERRKSLNLQSNRTIFTMKAQLLLAACALFFSTASMTGQNISLPAPHLDNNVSLATALQQRCSQRSYDSARPLDKQQLSNLLWAAWGYNRENKRTAPTALDKQDVTLYVFLAEGVYRYDARQNTLIEIAKGDHRAATGKQPFVETAPVNIVFVSDTRLLTNAVMSAVGCGAIAQNIYLYCASAGLATVVRGSFEADALTPLLGLDPSQKIMLAQSVGYPAL